MLTQTGINDESETLAGWLAILRRQLIQSDLAIDREQLYAIQQPERNLNREKIIKHATSAASLWPFGEAASQTGTTTTTRTH